jgi:hypothetical protein
MTALSLVAACRRRRRCCVERATAVGRTLPRHPFPASCSRSCPRERRRTSFRHQSLRGRAARKTSSLRPAKWCGAC